METGKSSRALALENKAVATDEDTKVMPLAQEVILGVSHLRSYISNNTL